eukprot:20304-Heterococcus_DN1.PRE.2
MTVQSALRRRRGGHVARYFRVCIRVHLVLQIPAVDLDHDLSDHPGLDALDSLGDSDPALGAHGLYLRAHQRADGFPEVLLHVVAHLAAAPCAVVCWQVAAPSQGIEGI